MSKLYKFFGGRKHAWGAIVMILVTVSAVFMSSEHYQEYCLFLLAVYGMIIGGNLGEHLILNRFNNVQTRKDEQSEVSDL